MWTRGSWAHFVLAVGFTALANVLAAATAVWTEWLSGSVRGVAWATLGVVWILAWLETRADWRRLMAERSLGERGADPVELADRGFRGALASYLAGDWVSAEQTLLKLLRLDPRDAEARLMLATLWRHEGRLDAAAQQLDQLELLETAADWGSEIAWERERILAASVIQEPVSPLVALDEPPANDTTLTTQPIETTAESTDRKLAA